LTLVNSSSQSWSNIMHELRGITAPCCTAELAAAGNVEKTLRLVISFGGLKRGQFLGALKERLAPACEKVG
jgi:hypothetical protein